MVAGATHGVQIRISMTNPDDESSGPRHGTSLLSAEISAKQISAQLRQEILASEQLLSRVSDQAASFKATALRSASTRSNQLYDAVVRSCIWGLLRNLADLYSVPATKFVLRAMAFQSFFALHVVVVFEFETPAELDALKPQLPLLTRGRHRAETWWLAIGMCMAVDNLRASNSPDQQLFPESMGFRVLGALTNVV